MSKRRLMQLASKIVTTLFGAWLITVVFLFGRNPITPIIEGDGWPELITLGFCLVIGIGILFLAVGTGDTFVEKYVLSSALPLGVNGVVEGVIAISPAIIGALTNFRMDPQGLMGGATQELPIAIAFNGLIVVLAVLRGPGGNVFMKLPHHTMIAHGVAMGFTALWVVLPNCSFIGIAIAAEVFCVYTSALHHTLEEIVQGAENTAREMKQEIEDVKEGGLKEAEAMLVGKKYPLLHAAEIIVFLAVGVFILHFAIEYFIEKIGNVPHMVSIMQSLNLVPDALVILAFGAWKDMHTLMRILFVSNLGLLALLLIQMLATIDITHGYGTYVVPDAMLTALLILVPTIFIVVSVIRHHETKMVQVKAEA